MEHVATLVFDELTDNAPSPLYDTLNVLVLAVAITVSVDAHDSDGLALTVVSMYVLNHAIIIL